MKQLEACGVPDTYSLVSSRRCCTSNSCPRSEPGPVRAEIYVLYHRRMAFQAGPQSHDPGKIRGIHSSNRTRHGPNINKAVLSAGDHHITLGMKGSTIEFL